MVDTHMHDVEVGKFLKYKLEAFKVHVDVQNQQIDEQKQKISDQNRQIAEQKQQIAELQQKLKERNDVLTEKTLPNLADIKFGGTFNLVYGTGESEVVLSFSDMETFEKSISIFERDPENPDVVILTKVANLIFKCLEEQLVPPFIIEKILLTTVISYESFERRIRRFLQRRNVDKEYIDNKRIVEDEYINSSPLAKYKLQEALDDCCDAYHEVSLDISKLLDKFNKTYRMLKNRQHKLDYAISNRDRHAVLKQYGFTNI